MRIILPVTRIVPIGAIDVTPRVDTRASAAKHRRVNGGAAGGFQESVRFWAVSFSSEAVMVWGEGGMRVAVS
jgi:hypothetical protein